MTIAFPAQYASVKRFVARPARRDVRLRPAWSSTTAPGEDYGKSRVMLSRRGNRRGWAGSRQLDAQRHA